MTYYILAGKDNKEKFNRFVKTMKGDNAWQEFSKKLSEKEKEKLDKQLEYNQKICLKLGIRRTPTILDDKFQEINPNTFNQK
jgi:protein-disulfide isomerase